MGAGAPSVVTIQPNGTTTTSARSQTLYPRRQFNPTIVGSVSSLVTSLTQLASDVFGASTCAYQNPVSECVQFLNVPVGNSGAKVVLAHSLGHAANWFVIGWRGKTTVAAPALVEDAQDAVHVLTDKNNLALRSYVSGTVDILAF